MTLEGPRLLGESSHSLVGPCAIILLLVLQATPSQAQWWGGSNGGYGNNGNVNNDPFDFGRGSNFRSETSYSAWNSTLTAHAVIASLVWAFFIPLGAIILRLNLKSPWVVRAHALLQITSYLAFIAAVGLGIYLTRMTNSVVSTYMWLDPHVILGLVILALAFFQPILGFINHRIFKRRLAKAQAGRSARAPGRTAPGHVHVWLGRILIVLGIVNGGLGIRLASTSPFQSSSTTRKAAIGYGIGAGLMFLIYFVIVIAAELRRSGQNQGVQRRSTARSAPRGGHNGSASSHTDSEDEVNVYHNKEQASRYT